MEFLTHTKIDFMKYRGFFVVFSILLLITAFSELFFFTGLNLGIDFAGGTQLTLKMRDEADPDTIRRALENEGVREPQIQRYGPVEEREVLIKVPVVQGSEEGSAATIIEALEKGLGNESGGRLDLNQRGVDSLTNLLMTEDPDDVVDIEEDKGRGHYGEMATAVLEVRKSQKIFQSWDNLQGIDGVSEAALAMLRERAFLGPFNVQQNDNVGPQIGGELRTKGLLAVLMSFVGMLLYIWYRFELRFGVGALVALIHDFMITLGLYALLNYEFNLPTIAAFLTLVGYSVNDTVVIFDRVRENMRRNRRMEFVEIINLSLNQTLTRTILTSGTTLTVVACLFFFGGEGLRGFAFVLLVGVMIGTYSSIFVASPFALLWEKYFTQQNSKTRRPGQPQTV